MKQLLFICALCLITGLSSFAQGGSPEYKDGMRIKFDSSGKKYIQFNTYATFWARHTRANPGTAINGVQKDSWSDFSIRQFRLTTYSQLGPRYLIIANIGIDNQTFSSGGSSGGGNTGNGSAQFQGTLGKKPELYVHDLWNEYAVLPDHKDASGRMNNVSLYVGTGLHYWMGISRMTTASSSNYLALDVPLYNWPLVDLSDQFARQIGVYAKGHVYKLSYRWAVNKPFTVLNQPVAYPAGAPDSGYAVDNNAAGGLSTTGYVAWQFFERESDFLPFTVGTYVGTKKVLNVGAGYYYTASGTTTQRSNTATAALQEHNIGLWAADVFADIPFGGNTSNWAFTGYSVYYNYHFGPGYLRNGSIMNVNAGAAERYNGVKSQAGFGNVAPIIGTGTSWFTQAGILLPKTMWRSAVRVQAFGEYSWQRFQRYGSNAFTYWSCGSNIFLDGHHARVTLKYQTRPVVVADRQYTSRGTFIVATQVSL